MEDIKSNLAKIKNTANAFEFDNPHVERDEILSRVELFIQNAFIAGASKDKLLEDLKSVSFYSCIYTGVETKQDEIKWFNIGKRSLLSVIKTIEESIDLYPEALNVSPIVKDKKTEKTFTTILKDWIIPIVGLILSAFGGYELHVANDIQNELKAELKSEIKMELQQDVSQMVKQEVQQKVDNQIIINNNK